MGYAVGLKSGLLGAACICSAGLGLSFSANAADFTPLGDLIGGEFNSLAFGISADGNVVVGEGTSS